MIINATTGIISGTPTGGAETGSATIILSPGGAEKVIDFEVTETALIDPTTYGFDLFVNAGDTGTITGSPSVTAIADQSGNSRNLTNGANITTGAATLGGKNVIGTSATNGTLDIPATVTSGSAAGIAIGLAFDPNSLLNNGQFLFDFGQEDYGVYASKSGGLLRFYLRPVAGIVRSLDSVALPTSGLVVAIMTYDGSTMRVEMNGSAATGTLASGNIDYGTFTNSRLFTRETGVQGARYNFGAMMVKTGAFGPSHQIITDMRNWLNAEFGA